MENAKLNNWNIQKELIYFHNKGKDVKFYLEFVIKIIIFCLIAPILDP